MAILNTGSKFPGTAANLDATIDWTDYNNIKADDGSTAYNSAYGTTKQLTGTNYGFSIPSNATIKGILLQIERYKSEAGSDATETLVQLKKTAGLVGNNKATTLESTNTVKSYGGSTDLWGTTWTPADINSSNFGAAYKITHTTGGGNVYVDYFKITVYYTVPDTDSVCGYFEV